ncbi:MAG: manganese efflux pump MntP family protein [Sphingomonadaceae bacterium]
MEFFPLLGIAFGLAMDAFSVAVASGIMLGTVTHRQAFRLSFHFGLFQAGMPVLGWLAGSLVAQQIGAFDHWVAFGLLGYVGGKMLWEAFRSEAECVRGDPTRGSTLIMLSLATSIDALAIGLSLALLRVPVLFPALVIGLVACTMTGVGLQLGKRAGHLLGNKMEILGGLVLIGIGFKILLSHL